MRKTVVPIFIIAFLISSCDNKVKEYYDDGKKKSEYYINNNDEIDGIYKEFYEKTGELKIIASYNSGQLEGEKRTFFKNGKIQSIENYTSNMLFGVCKYYTSEGELKAIRNYILVNPKLYGDVNWSDFHNYIKEVFLDTIKDKKSQLNSVLVFDSNGKVNKNQSHYFEIALKSDTINYSDSIKAVLVFGYRRDGEKTKFRVIQFANEKMDLYNVYDSENDNVFFQDKPHRRGVNYLRGWIEEYTPYGFDSLRNVLIFEKKYFVK